MDFLLSRRTLLRALGGAALIGGGRWSAASEKEDRMQAEALAFLDALDAERRARATFPFASEERFDWHYVPRTRQGLPLAALTAAQRRAALRLLEASLCPDGFARVEAIRSLEPVLHALEQGHGPLRDAENYAVSVFGTPAPIGAWGWRFEGHHVSLHWTLRNGRVVATTPQFLGANPAEVRDGPRKGLHVLRSEDELGRRLAASLTGEQRRAGLAADRAPADILSTNQRVAARQAEVGIAYRALGPEQRAILLATIRQHAAVQRDDVGRERLARIQAAGMDAVVFAWMGGLAPGEGHYYRIQGPTCLIELDNTQDGANHIHCVWRDFTGDWGLDVLAMHYGSSPHQGGS